MPLSGMIKVLFYVMIDYTLSHLDRPFDEMLQNVIA